MRTKNLELMMIFLVAIAVIVTIGLVVWFDMKSDQLEQNYSVDAENVSELYVSDAN